MAFKKTLTNILLASSLVFTGCDGSSNSNEPKNSYQTNYATNGNVSPEQKTQQEEEDSCGESALKIDETTIAGIPLSAYAQSVNVGCPTFSAVIQTTSGELIIAHAYVRAGTLREKYLNATVAVALLQSEINRPFEERKPIEMTGHFERNNSYFETYRFKVRGKPISLTER